MNCMFKKCSIMLMLYLVKTSILLTYYFHNIFDKNQKINHSSNKNGRLWHWKHHINILAIFGNKMYIIIIKLCLNFKFKNKIGQKIISAKLMLFLQVKSLYQWHLHIYFFILTKYRIRGIYIQKRYSRWNLQLPIVHLWSVDRT